MLQVVALCNLWVDRCLASMIGTQIYHQLLHKIWGDQTDVPESSDWYNSGYIMTWGLNVPMTRTSDANFLAEVRYKGTKVVSVSPDFAESTKFADDWISVKQGTDDALAMAMGHVILQEFYVDNQVEYFTKYAKHILIFLSSSH